MDIAKILMKLLGLSFVCGFGLIAKITAADTGSGVYVNGVELNQQTLSALEQRYGIRVADARLNGQQVTRIRQTFGVDVQSGRFWYDRISGAWGYERLPAAGQVQSNLPIGGGFKANASGGGTNVIVNGRILHPTEVRYLRQRFGSVTPGRYFLLADGSYGFEGGGVMGTLAPQRGSVFTGRDKFGTVIGDGDFVGYLPPSSGGVGFTCAPDGGCIYD